MKIFKIITPIYIQEKFKIKKVMNLKNISSKVHIDGKISIRYKSISIGAYTFLGDNLSLENVKNIGRYCSISNGVRIGLAQHPIDWISTSAVFCNPNRGFVSENLFKTDIDKYCDIGNDVWIGTNSLIMSGVNIGNGAIVGAGSIVTKDVPDYAIVGGNPAKIIRYRFNNEIIDSLTSSKWWEKEPSEILQSGLDITNINSVIEKI
ncbi:CatB-related O-acetyltransferase [Marinilactibacillus psychrotolerans]|uniref:Chloramphenicol acetyltransferase n=1 Tax=Marinilactibacillus psychrotolerans TaxID=191770 RepID=A0AAV3WPF8_9LACT|nr:CatB-related O-acetyltransferase [Marinilactibacillus psychrotolerans]GEL67590.1 hypothetical protein MPS01_17450 [Marinilactibacillus psychrotolerans]GEQ35524.1 chloramphenicol acetyltransferase [Marinilactibacillus psychrotolerans]SDD08311.1 Acetyltransferase (isoleucine patch superfamily) [Marinilactibacillus psychrotolerans]